MSAKQINKARHKIDEIVRINNDRQRHERIQSALEALELAAKLTEADGDDYEAIERAQYDSLDAAALAGYNWQEDEDLVRYCLKATAAECAAETLRCFRIWAGRDGLRDDIVTVHDDLLNQEVMTSAEIMDLTDTMEDLFRQEGI